MNRDVSARPPDFLEEIRAAQAAYATLGPLSAHDDWRDGNAEIGVTITKLPAFNFRFSRDMRFFAG
jgi:hypothetical protein